MSSELSGAVIILSGRMDAVENGNAYLTQQILQVTDTTSFSNYQVIWNSQFRIIAEDVCLLKRQVSILQNLLVNLNINVSNNLTSFRTHTGLTATLGHLGLV